MNNKYFFYKTDGSSHYEGIENEKDVKSFLETKYKKEKNDFLKLKIKDFDLLQIKHVGTTKTKSDINICYGSNNCYTLSIKQNKIREKRRSTFDYLNTSKINCYLNKDDSQKLKKINDEILLLKKKYYEIEDKKEFVKREIEEKIDNFFNNSNINLKSLFSKIKLNFTDFLVIAEKYENQINNKLLFFEKKERYDYNLFSKQKFELKKITQKKSSSRKIFINDIDSGIRIRISLNNGVGALLGLSKSNSSSILTLKIQLDNVSKFIENSNHLKYDFN